jgi:hypothetical protein
MIETGECLVTAAGGSRSEGVRVPVARSASAAAVSTSVLVPVAGSDRGRPDVDRPAQAPEADLGPDRPD